jgi:hypothetical protein
MARSSSKAIANGIPTSNTLDVIIHRALPVNSRPEPAKLVACLNVLVMEERVRGGIMSCRATMRSYRDSSSGSDDVVDDASESGLVSDALKG